MSKAKSFPTEIFLDNDFFLEVSELSKRSVTNGEVEIQTGWVDLTMYLAATDQEDAVALHGSLSQIMVEDGAVLGTYRGAFAGSNLTAQLSSTYPDGTTIHLHVEKGALYHVSEPMIVRHRRPA